MRCGSWRISARTCPVSPRVRPPHGSGGVASVSAGLPENGSAALKYLGAYVARTAIGDGRILTVTDQTVTFRWKNRDAVSVLSPAHAPLADVGLALASAGAAQPQHGHVHLHAMKHTVTNFSGTVCALLLSRGLSHTPHRSKSAATAALFPQSRGPFHPFLAAQSMREARILI